MNTTDIFNPVEVLKLNLYNKSFPNKGRLLCLFKNGNQNDYSRFV